MLLDFVDHLQKKVNDEVDEATIDIFHCFETPWIFKSATCMVPINKS